MFLYILNKHNQEKKCIWLWDSPDYDIDKEAETFFFIINVIYIISISMTTLRRVPAPLDWGPLLAYHPCHGTLLSLRQPHIQYSWSKFSFCKVLVDDQQQCSRSTGVRWSVEKTGDPGGLGSVRRWGICFPSQCVYLQKQEYYGGNQSALSSRHPINIQKPLGTGNVGILWGGETFHCSRVSLAFWLLVSNARTPAHVDFCPV